MQQDGAQRAIRRGPVRVIDRGEGDGGGSDGGRLGGGRKSCERRGRPKLAPPGKTCPEVLHVASAPIIPNEARRVRRVGVVLNIELTP